MAHEIHRNENGKYSFAYVGEQTWHGLGQRLTPDAPIPLWIEEAGFNWQIKEAKVMGAYDENENGTASLIEMPDRKMLLRSDTHAPLAVVGNRYNVVQPPEVIEFYEDLVAAGGFHLETAGILFGGRRMFALAKMHEEEMVIKGDPVKGYLLLSTACDGTMATQVQFTSVRVVCNNTLQMAIREQDRADKELPKIRIPHSAKFNAQKVKEQLGLAPGSFQLFMQDMRRLAARPLSNKEGIAFLVGLVGNPQVALEDQEVKDANLMKQIWALYEGAGKGADMVGRTAWGMLNAVTEYCDHHTGHKTDDARIDSAWFGANANLKVKAYNELMMTLA